MKASLAYIERLFLKTKQAQPPEHALCGPQKWGSGCDSAHSVSSEEAQESRLTWLTILLSSPDWLGIPSVDWDGHKLNDLPASASQEPGLQTCATMLSLGRHSIVIGTLRKEPYSWEGHLILFKTVFSKCPISN